MVITQTVHSKSSKFIQISMIYWDKNLYITEYIIINLIIGRALLIEDEDERQLASLIVAQKDKNTLAVRLGKRNTMIFMSVMFTISMMIPAVLLVFEHYREKMKEKLQVWQSVYESS